MANNVSLDVSQINSTIADFNDPHEWSYRCEGSVTMVVSLSKMRTVLRLRKHECKKSSTLKEDYLRETLDNLDFAKYVVSPLIGDDYVHVGKVISVPRDFVSAMNEVCRGHRPQHRLDKEIDESCFWGVLMPDFCFVTLASTTSPDEGHSQVTNETRNPTFSVEIKPKCGFLPTSPYIDPSRAIKYSVCQYCMLQKSKVTEGKYSRESKYCPLDLFSREPRRAIYALECLVSDPQNNLRVFCDGRGIFTEELVQEAIQNGSVCCAEKFFEVTLKEMDGFNDCVMAGQKCGDDVITDCHKCGDGGTTDCHKYGDCVTSDCHKCKDGVTTDCHKYKDGMTTDCHKCEDGVTTDCHKYGDHVTTDCHKCGDSVTMESHECEEGVTKGDSMTEECKDDVTKDGHKSEGNMTTEGHKCGHVGTFTRKFLDILLEILISDSKNSKVSLNQVNTSPTTQICEGSKYSESKINIQSNLNHLQFGPGGVLQHLLSVQKLDDMDIEGIHKLYQEVISHFECNPGVRDSLGVDGPYTLPLWKSVASLDSSTPEVSQNTIDITSQALHCAVQNNLHEAVIKICKFAVASTAKDCSVMIAFQKTSNNDTTVPTIETTNGNMFYYNIDLVDLDPKEFDRVLKYYKDSKNVVKNYVE